MAKYEIPRDEYGRRVGGSLRMVDANEKPVEIPRAVAATLPGGAKEHKEVFQCTVCEEKQRMRQFLLPAHASNHIRQSHPDRYEDKDSWRKLMRTVTVTREGGGGE